MTIRAFPSVNFAFTGQDNFGSTLQAQCSALRRWKGAPLGHSVYNNNPQLAQIESALSGCDQKILNTYLGST